MVLERFSLAGKVALITGAGGGIGSAIAEGFAEAGAAVACVDLELAAAKRTAQAIEASGGKALALAGDVADETDAAGFVSKAVERFGRLDVLVSGAAGNDPSGSVSDYSYADWNRVMAVNLGGAFLLSRAAIPHLAAAGGGSIILIASQLGSVAAPGRVAYCTTKGGLIQMARAMATDHAAQGIRVNTLSPGAVETPRLVSRFGSMEAARAVAGPHHLLGRLGQPLEIATAALFLASDAASFMTGTDLLVDGGYNAT
jgi:NAD(P)-dependent dehydrogenase (short-subunit alcohol dehydrogenase family)